LVLNVLWLLLDVINVENLDLIKKLIFVQIVAIELQGLLSHLSEISQDYVPERILGSLTMAVGRTQRHYCNKCHLKRPKCICKKQ